MKCVIRGNGVRVFEGDSIVSVKISSWSGI